MSKFEIVNFHSPCLDEETDNDIREQNSFDKFALKKQHSEDEIEDKFSFSEKKREENVELSNVSEDKFSFTKNKFEFAKRKPDSSESESSPPRKKSKAVTDEDRDVEKDMREEVEVELEEEAEKRVVKKINVPNLPAEIPAIDGNFQKRLEKLEKEFSDFKTQQIRLLVNPEYMTDPPITY